ncbi:MAG: hypothetical protein ACE37B_08760 [Ilumatobacter sp.]|jgi:hypothetical protein|uniref:hypothetical protein n=1 Tax=Ilumatobacter sp. TaxID=1967498 RepID=UPI00391DAA24
MAARIELGRKFVRPQRTPDANAPDPIANRLRTVANMATAWTKQPRAGIADIAVATIGSRG